MMRRPNFFTIVALFVLGSVMPLTAQAAEPRMDCTSVVQMMIGQGPLPIAALSEPTDWDELSELIGESAWKMPVQAEWPMDLSDRPIVETRRNDKMWHTVESWDTAARLRRMYRRTNAQLRELNPEIDLYDLEEGQEVLVWRRDEEHTPESRGEPQAGRLIYGEPFPESENYLILYPHRAFGTYYAVSETVRALDAYYDEFPNADPLIVGDLSVRTGRAMGPHSSHQSGRDVDVTLPRIEPPPNYNRFHHIRRDNLDAERALWLLTSVIDGGFVEYVFLDWHHQRTLWTLAKEQGAPEEWLEEVFQYPRRGGTGIVRHSPGHATHFHFRFRCQETDRWCN